MWQETQNVQADATGHYAVQLGSTLPAGLPKDLFISGEARWLGVQPEGQAEQPRVLLLSVPYALKAGDAETLGGLPPSAFVLNTPPFWVQLRLRQQIPSARWNHHRRHCWIRIVRRSYHRLGKPGIDHLLRRKPDPQMDRERLGLQQVNEDFRYELTSIGAPGPNLYVAEEIQDGHFKIALAEEQGRKSPGRSTQYVTTPMPRPIPSMWK